MSHPTHYPAKPDPNAPHGWSTEEGMFFRPDWGDRLETVEGITFIVVKTMLPVGYDRCDRPSYSAPVS